MQDKVDPHTAVSDLYKYYAPRIGQNLWPWEKARWYELAYCILAVHSEPALVPRQVRSLAQSLSRLGLLEPNELADMMDIKGTVDCNQELCVAIQAVLVRAGLNEAQVNEAITMLGEAAWLVNSKYGGKIQRLLQEHGQNLLAALQEDFNFSRRGRDHRILALWLQNVLNMPLAVKGFISKDACSLLGLEYDSLALAAEDQDMNIALLDDVLRAFWSETKQIDVPEEGKDTWEPQS